MTANFSMAGKIINIGAMKQKIANGKYETWEEIEAEIEKWHQRIADITVEYKEIFERCQVCTHEYGRATYTLRSGIFRYETKAYYEHGCKLCGHREYYSENSDATAPEWIKDAARQYYNNDI